MNYSAQNNAVPWFPIFTQLLNINHNYPTVLFNIEPVIIKLWNFFFSLTLVSLEMRHLCSELWDCSPGQDAIPDQTLQRNTNPSLHSGSSWVRVKERTQLHLLVLQHIFIVRPRYGSTTVKIWAPRMRGKFASNQLLKHSMHKLIGIDR